MSVSKIDILNKKFNRQALGYSRLEVDQFLMDIAEVLGRAAEANKEKVRKIKKLEARMREYRQRDETLRDTLMSTQKMVDDLKVSAGKEAQIILDEARAKADKMLQQGHNRLAQISEEIEAMKRQRTQFRAQMEGLLETHFRLLEDESPEKEKMEAIEAKLTYLKKAE